MKKPKFICREAKATWGKIKNWDKLSAAHKELLNKQLNPIYREIEPRATIAKPQDYFIQKNSTVRTYDNE